MSESPIAAAFEGFRMIIRRPASFLAWCVLLGFASFASGAIQAASVAPGAVGDPGWGILFFLLKLAVFLLTLGVAACAVYRAVLHPDRRRFAYLRLGEGELRVVGIWFGLAVCVGIAMLVVNFILSLITNAFGIWVRALPIVIVYAGLAALGVRLSLTGPIALIGRLDGVADSWELTGKRFWSLLGMWAIVAAASLLLLFAYTMLMGALTAGVGMARRAVVPLPVAGQLVGLVVGAPFAAFQTVLWAAPAAAAYKRLTHREETPVEVFD